MHILLRLLTFKLFIIHLNETKEKITTTPQANHHRVNRITDSVYNRVTEKRFPVDALHLQKHLAILNACRYSDASLIALAVSLSKWNER